MNTLEFESLDETDTRRLARALADCMEQPTVVVLTGPLGSGKTRFVQFFAATQSIDEAVVNSPTYVICQQYAGDRSICHLDVYRLNSQEEFLELGPDELFAADDVTFIEWGERVAGCLPEDRIEISIVVTGERARSFTMTARQSLVESVASRLAEV